jgi:hypothetical protein
MRRMRVTSLLSCRESFPYFHNGSLMNADTGLRSSIASEFAFDLPFAAECRRRGNRPELLNI